MIRFFLLSISILLLALGCSGPGSLQSGISPGESKIVHNLNDATWYNRKIGSAKYMIAIQEGDFVSAIKHARQQGHDAEAYFLLSVANAWLNQADSAMHFLNLAVESGLDPGRFMAGPSEILKPLYELPEYERWLAGQKLFPVHGPMIGNVSDTSAILWARTSSQMSLQFVLSEKTSFRKPIYSEVVETQPEDEFASQVTISGLKPNNLYYYRIILNGKTLPSTFSFKTQPRQFQPSEIVIAFGGGAAYIPWHRKMWTTLASHQLNALLMLGDNVYIDYPENTPIQQYCYYQRQSEPEWRHLTSRTPVYAIWDDHDFGDNDEYGGPEIDNPSWKIPVYKTFTNQWANASYGGGISQPGVWFSFVLGEVEFFMLDCRYYREPSFVGDTLSNPSMLGPVQKKWLLDGLASSKAAFKVIVSAVPWADGAKHDMEGKFDTWKGYASERQEIFNHLTNNEISGVLLLAGDRHRSDVWLHERENDYPLFEFMSSRLTNMHKHACMPEAIFCYNENSFGKLIFRTHLPDPEVVFQIWNIDNEMVYESFLNLSLIK
jgi:alkaline phosphatase D